MTRPLPDTAGKLTIRLLYLSGVVQGLALVTFPAASAIFTSPSGFGLSGTQYGAMFAPQVALAILASALGPNLAARIGLRGVLLLGLASDALSMTLLSSSALLTGSGAAFPLLCVATGALGLGFGATVMALNTAVEALSPGDEDGAVLVLNALLGVGTALAPLFVALFTALHVWWALPLLAAMLTIFLIVAFATSRPELGSAKRPSGTVAALPRRFWLYAGAALLYGIVETLCGNWGGVYLSAQRHVSARDASFALTAFWLAVTLGRVLFAFAGKVIPPRRLYVILPAALAGVFLLVVRADGAMTGVAAFAAAGLACSALLPLSISFGGAEFASRSATISGELIAIYQVGYGVAAFGVGPLREFGGLDYATAFSIGAVCALALCAVAFLIVRRPSPA